MDRKIYKLDGKLCEDTIFSSLHQVATNRVSLSELIRLWLLFSALLSCKGKILQYNLNKTFYDIYCKAGNIMTKYND